MKIHIASPSLMSGFEVVSRAVGVEVWLELGKPDSARILELASRGNEDALLLAAIDLINTGDKSKGVDIIEKCADKFNGVALELRAAMKCEGWNQVNAFDTLFQLHPSSDCRCPRLMVSLIFLHEIGFFQAFSGLINDGCIAEKLDSDCAKDHEICAEVSLALYEAGFKQKACEWAQKSVEREESGAWFVHAEVAKAKGDVVEYERRVKEGAEKGNAECCFCVSKALWREADCNSEFKDFHYQELARRMARTAAAAGKTDAMILFGMMASSGFGGAVDKKEALGALMTAYFFEPTSQLSALIQRISGGVPEVLGVNAALDWMLSSLDYPLHFRALALAGILKNTFTIASKSEIPFDF